MPPGPVHEQRGVRAGCDVTADLVDVELHGLGIGVGKRQTGADAARRADGAEQICAAVALIRRLAGPGSAARPLPDDAVLLPDPGFVLPPDLDRLALRQIGQMRAQRAREVFLNSATIRVSCPGCRGLALTCEKPSSFKSLPTCRS